jgi:hypothetical protein
LELKGIHDCTNHCIEDVLMSYCLYNNINYIYMYSDSWTFKIDKDAKSIASIIGSSIINEKFPHRVTFEKLMGIKIGVVEKSILEINKLLDNGSFLFALYDSYYCHWDASFHKYRISHCFFITDISEDKLICEDPYLSKINIQLSYDEFICNGGRLFQCDDTNYLDNLSWSKVVQHSLSFIDEDFNNIRYFAGRIKKGTSFEDLNNYEDIFYSPLLRNIGYISNSRLNLGKLYRYIAQKNNVEIFNEFSLEMDEIGAEWQSIKNKITKCYFLKDNYEYRIKIFDDLNKVADREEGLFNKLKKIII